MKEEDKGKWYLDKLELNFKRPGYDEPLNKGRYEGTIKFENGHFESFNFKIHPEMAQDYLSLISDNIIKSANELGQKLLESLNLVKANNLHPKE